MGLPTKSAGSASAFDLGLPSLPPLPSLASDPMFDALKSQAQAGAVDQLSKEAAGDSAALMARYGTRLALTKAGAAT